MKDTAAKYLLSSVMAVFLLLAATVFSQWQPEPTVTIPADNRLTVSVLDVGQGDSILIETPNEKTILIDGGPDQSLVQKLGEELPFFQHDIDIVLLTHPHADHVSGLVEVLRRYTVHEIYMTGVMHTAPDYIAFLKEIKNQNIPVHVVDHQETVAIDQGISLELLYPTKSLAKQTVEELNHTSIVARLVHGSREFMFTGDAEVEDEAVILASGKDLSSDVLKLGHHGSSTSSSVAWLDAVDPAYGVISVGEGNSYGHPHLSVLRRLGEYGINVLRTDEQGTVHFVTDGVGLEIY